MKKQLIGQEAPLKYKSPLEGGMDGFSDGLRQLLGEQAPIDETPSRLNPINAGADKGVRQLIGSEAPLDRQPRHGWQSYPHPANSKRTEEQSR